MKCDIVQSSWSKVKMFLALCLLMIVGAYAQVPATCPGPQAFEGRFGRFDRERGYQVKGFIAYDETQRRVREIEDVDIKGQKSAFESLKVYEQNIEYRVDLNTRKCNITQPRYPFRPIGVPPEAKYEFEGVIGAAGKAGESLTVASFNATFEGNTYFVIVTYPDCFPVTHGFRSSKGEIEMTNYYDLQSGVSDPELFLPPRECIYDRERHYMVRGKMVYDGLNKRIAEFEDRRINSTETYYAKLKLYNENKEYSLDLKTRKCNVTAPRHPFHPYGVPPGGVFKAEAVIGAAGITGEAVTIADFAEVSSNKTGFYALVTEPDCFPVHIVFFDENDFEETSFYDLQEGITDPDAFEIPKECAGL